MRVEARRRRRVGLAGHQPRRPVVGVAVALAVHRHHVQQNVVAHFVLAVGVEERAREGDAHRREHPPTLQDSIIIIFF